MPRMERPSFHEIYMRLACDLSKRSTCKRLQVGTVISSTDFRKILAVGYNGNASGLFNGCDTSFPGKCGCLHSEENATINCDVPRYVEKIVFVTHLPCVMCAKRLINLGNVVEIFYLNTYRSMDSMVLLAQAGISIKQLGQTNERFFSWDTHKDTIMSESNKYNYDIQGQISSVDESSGSTKFVSEQQDYGRYAEADLGKPDMIPATAPGLVAPVVPGEALTDAQKEMTQTIMIDPVTSALQANVEAAKDSGVIDVSEEDVKSKQNVSGVLGFTETI